MRFAGCAWLFVRGLVCCQSDTNSVQNRLQGVRSVQFACLIGLAVGSFSSFQSTAAKIFSSFSSVHSVQFASSSDPDHLLSDWQLHQGIDILIII